ncbi:uncharacterized protein EI90DRAFT_3121152 [Cantharellus anzutake]|uniref:uncharacterized protein n=1 Tax=Cantharellus anzutake TaxID=1750568 RepID=UPI001908D65A|nr:uncharacterized protein EI90DRAFT_3129478 [Cantharellus anzutake]XP_038918221.1 uncharacterized protein EI90DRAFT_3121152 [Cantharellus anzutake]KAF8324747.1 hypothetical protein EI90DRAFT_3129478 [Cantharellus anzutake]KAF8334715.1 hypothetical protein EI90DRAFT_3121152 [Cantharellus anzutake]
MAAISVLYSIALAFILSTQAFPTSRSWRGGPPHMNGEEARALHYSTRGDSLRTGRDFSQSLCHLMNEDQMNQMDLLLQKAKEYAIYTWGPGWDQVLVNPEGYPWGTAYACYPFSMNYTVIWDAEPSCTLSIASDNGTIWRGIDYAQLSLSQGTLSQTTSTVTSSTAMASGTSFTVKLEAGPDMLKTGFEQQTSWTTTNTNSKGDSVEVGYDTRSTLTNAIQCTGPVNVTMYAQVRTCSYQGGYTIPITMHGWLWFYYPDLIQEHFEWAVNMDAITNLDVRQQNITMAVNLDTESWGNFFATCTPLNESTSSANPPTLTTIGAIPTTFGVSPTANGARPP